MYALHIFCVIFLPAVDEDLIQFLLFLLPHNVCILFLLWCIFVTCSETCISCSSALACISHSSSLGDGDSVPSLLLVWGKPRLEVRVCLGENQEEERWVTPTNLGESWELETWGVSWSHGERRIGWKLIKRTVLPFADLHICAQILAASVKDWTLFSEEFERFWKKRSPCTDIGVHLRKSLAALVNHPQVTSSSKQASTMCTAFLTSAELS